MKLGKGREIISNRLPGAVKDRDRRSTTKSKRMRGIFETYYNDLFASKILGGDQLTHYARRHSTGNVKRIKVYTEENGLRKRPGKRRNQSRTSESNSLVPSEVCG